MFIVPDERPVFMREVNNNMYTVSAYFIAKVTSELPVGIITPVLFGSLVYYAIGFNTQESDRFPFFCTSITHDF